jgi:hypothetical protein
MSWFKVFSTLYLCLSCCGVWGHQYCEDLDGLFGPGQSALLAGPDLTLRRVDPVNGLDSAECLNNEQAANPPTCRTLQYALHESEDTSVGTTTPNLRVELGRGEYQSINQSSKILNTNNVTIVGAGISQTIIVCGESGSQDSPCDYQNAQISNASHVYVTGITFTGCGPVTSALYVATSNFIFIDQCSFEYVVV